MQIAKSCFDLYLETICRTRQGIIGQENPRENAGSTKDGRRGETDAERGSLQTRPDPAPKAAVSLLWGRFI